MAWTDPRTWVTDELVTAAMMNAHVRDNLDVIGPQFRARTTSDQIVGSTTLTNVTAFVLPIAASEVWAIELHLSTYVPGSSDWKHAFVVPAGATGYHYGSAVAAGTITSYFQRRAFGVDGVFGTGSDTEVIMDIRAVVVNSTTPGTVQFQFAGFSGGGPTLYEHLSCSHSDSDVSEDWYPENYYSDPLPHYETMPAYLRVEDIFAPTLEAGAAKFWRTQRAAGLAQWLPVGFEIRVRDRTPEFGYRKHRVTLAVNANQYNYPAHGCFGCWPPGQGDKDEPCSSCARRGIGWISIDDDVWRQAWLGRNGQYLRYLVAHEFGHCLGFTHGGTGIMDATPYHAEVNAEEIVAAKDYWGIP